MIETMIIDMVEFLPFSFALGKLYTNPPNKLPGRYSPGAFRSKFSPFPSGGTGIQVDDPSGAYGTREIDTSNIDFGNKQQVMNIQQALIDAGATDEQGNPITKDGIFGPNTEFAYRNMINKQRTEQGKDAFGYGTNNVNDVTDANNNINTVEPDTVLTKLGNKTQKVGNALTSAPQNVWDKLKSVPQTLGYGIHDALNPDAISDNLYDDYPELNANNPNLTQNVSEFEGDPDWVHANNPGITNEVSDYDISEQERKARDRAASGQYVWNKQYREKYAPGTSLWDFLK